MKTKPWYRYNRNVGLPGHIEVHGTPQGCEGNEITFELVILSKFIWGRGAAANSIFNTGSMIVKFQGPKEDNERRAKLLTKVWRLCKINGHEIHKLPIRQSGELASQNKYPFTEDPIELIDYISQFNSVVKKP
jgi:hypothetical protein